MWYPKTEGTSSLISRQDTLLFLLAEGREKTTKTTTTEKQKLDTITGSRGSIEGYNVNLLLA